jgi:hypothetical protein
MTEPVDPTSISLPIPGKEVIFRHMDDPDMPWQLCRAQRNADGTESYVREKWFAFSPDPQYLSLYAEYDPGMIVRRHGHYSPHIVFVIDGGGVVRYAHRAIAGLTYRPVDELVAVLRGLSA